MASGVWHRGGCNHHQPHPTPHRTYIQAHSDSWHAAQVERSALERSQRQSASIIFMENSGRQGRADCGTRGIVKSSPAWRLYVVLFSAQGATELFRAVQ